MTTEERVEALEAEADQMLQSYGRDRGLQAIVLELRALRLMLRDELRELSWAVRLRQGGKE